MFHYVYRITNKKENKHYYGVRSSKIDPKLDLGHLYFSSSSINEFIMEQKTSPEIFKYKVILRFETREKANDFEVKIHNKFNVAKNILFYNVVNARGGFDRAGIKLPKELREKYSKISSVKRKKTMSEYTPERKKQYINKKSESAKRYYKYCSDEEKRTKSNSSKEGHYRWWNSLSEQEQITYKQNRKEKYLKDRSENPEKYKDASIKAAESMKSKSKKEKQLINNKKIATRNLQRTKYIILISPNSEEYIFNTNKELERFCLGLGISYNSLRLKKDEYSKEITEASFNYDSKYFRGIIRDTIGWSIFKYRRVKI